MKKWLPLMIQGQEFEKMAHKQTANLQYCILHGGVHNWPIEGLDSNCFRDPIDGNLSISMLQSGDFNVIIAQNGFDV